MDDAIHGVREMEISPSTEATPTDLPSPTSTATSTRFGQEGVSSEQAEEQARIRKMIIEIQIDASFSPVEKAKKMQV